MKTPTKDEIEFKKKQEMVSMIINHNGNVGYRMFTGRRPQHAIKITGISSPIQAKPIFVGFVDPELMQVMASNDMDNPDGSKAPEPLPAIVAAQLPKLKKKTSLRVIK